MEKIFELALNWCKSNDLHFFINYNLKRNRRLREVVEFRAIIYHLIKKYTKSSLPEIATFFNRKAHGTVIRGLKLYDELYSTSLPFRTKANSIEKYVFERISAKRSIYLSGTISKHLEEYGWEYVLNKFQTIENTFDKDLYIIHNPTKFFTDEELATFEQIDFMNRCISIIINDCTDMYMLKDYKESYNAQIELSIAQSMNLNIIYETT